VIRGGPDEYIKAAVA